MYVELVAKVRGMCPEFGTSSPNVLIASMSCYFITISVFLSSLIIMFIPRNV